MSDNTEEIQKLIRLKRYEMPPDGYFEDFLKEFQNRQRSELMRRSARSLFFERVSTYFSGFGAPRWAGAAAGACAAVLVAFIALRGDNPVAAPSSQEVAGAPSTVQPAALASRALPVTPVSLLFIDDLHPTPSNSTFDRPLVEAEGPFSDLYILHNPVFAPNLRSGLSLDF